MSWILIAFGAGALMITTGRWLHRVMTGGVALLALTLASSALVPAGSAAGAARNARPRYCHSGGARLWADLAACGWPGQGNTGPVYSSCPRHRLVRRGTSLSARIIISTPGRVIRCQKITGMVYVEAPGVTIENSTVTANSGRKGLAANGTAGIFVADGASATIDHVTINGDDGVHACIWHQGTAMTVNALDCHGVNDGIFTWADTPVAGDHFTIENSYFHGFTHATANGHEDGFQTEGASYGLIQHNTYQMSTTANSAVAIWDSLERARRITVAHNLITGGGFAMYAEDYSPGDSRPGDPSAIGGFAVTGIWFSGNIFSVAAAGCVGKYGVWFTRPAWPPYDGGPTDGWHRHGNIVLETGEHIDAGNPHVHGQLCR